MFSYHCRLGGKHTWSYSVNSNNIYCVMCGVVNTELTQVAKDGGYSLRDKMADRLIAGGLEQEAAVKAASAVRLSL